MFELNPFKNSFGLDISENIVRLAKIVKTRKNNHLISLNEEKIKEGVIFEGEIKNEVKLKESIQKLINTVNGKKIRTRYVKSVIPERKTFIKMIQIPKTKKTDLSEAVKWEAAQHIPLSLDEIYLDWQIINVQSATQKINVLVAAAPKIIVNSYCSLFESLNLIPISLEIESLSTIRSILPKEKDVKDSLLVIDIGGVHTNLIIYDKNTIQFSSSISFSGNSITKIIAKKLKIKESDAEKLKLIYGLEKKKGKGKLKSIIEPELKDLVDKIKQTQNFYINHFSGAEKFKKIIISGGGSQMKHLPQFLSEKLNVSASVANPLSNIKINKKLEQILKNNAPSFTTAIGLALK